MTRFMIHTVLLMGIIVLPQRQAAAEDVTWPEYTLANQKLVIPAASKIAKFFTVRTPGELMVRAVEVFGARIGFKVLQNGRTIFNSRSRKGRASGRVSVGKGTISVVFINYNILSKKSLKILIKFAPGR